MLRFKITQSNQEGFTNYRVLKLSGDGFLDQVRLGYVEKKSVSDKFIFTPEPSLVMEESDLLEIQNFLDNQNSL